MNPNSFTQRSSSSMQLAGDTPGVCGSWHTPTKFSGNSSQTRKIRSLQCWVQCRLVVASPMWCDIADARGEKIVTSVPRSRWNFSCGCTLSRSSSSLIASVPRVAAGVPPFKLAICASR
jgi:hypothetical protein